jgi:hypothetical protein
MSFVDQSLIIEPSGPGFRIEIIVLSPRDVIVWMGGWSDDAYSWSQIEALVQAALRGRVRVTVTTLGGKPWKYDLQCMNQSGTWWSHGELQHVRFPRLWRKTESFILQYPVNDRTATTCSFEGR